MVIENIIHNFAHHSLKDNYRKTLESSLNNIDKWFGENLLGKKVLYRCLSISLVYSVLFFLLGWSFGSSGKLGDLQLVRTNPSIPHLRFLLPIGTLSVILFLGLARKKLSDSLYLSVAAGILFGLIVGFFLSAGVGVLFLAGAGVGLLALTGQEKGTLVFTVTIAISLSIVGALSKNISNEMISFLMFGALIPIVNSIFDWILWGASRYLGRFILNNYEKSHSMAIIIVVVIVDFLIAILLLIVLTFCIPFSIKIFNLFIKMGGGCKIPHYFTKNLGKNLTLFYHEILLTFCYITESSIFLKRT